MIIGVDIETQGLDATKFILGSVVRDDGKEKVFLKKEEMKKYILDLGESQKRQGKTLTVLGFNHQYDFYGYMGVETKGLQIYCTEPFIAGIGKEIILYEGGDYEEAREAKDKHNRSEIIKTGNKYVVKKRKDWIKFLDVYYLYPRMSLKKVGELIGLKKKEMPRELTFETERTYDFWQLNQIGRYCVRDAKITLMAYKRMKKKLEEKGLRLQKLYTTGQIGIKYVLKKIKESGRGEHILTKSKDLKTHSTKYRNIIHSGNRGGRVEAFQTGYFESVTELDVNSLYPYACMNMEVPDLRTERMITRPLEIYELKDLLRLTGVSECLLINKKDDLGLLSVRKKEGNFYPKKGSVVVGAYNHIELRKALREGWEIKHVEKSVVYDKGENVFKPVFEEMYDNRMNEENEFDKYFWKNLMNNCIGKTAQRRTGKRVKIISVNDIDEYLAEGWDINRIIGFEAVMTKKEEFRKKGFYMPIINGLVTSWAKCYMYDQYKKIRKKDLIYTDTDNIIFTGNYKKKFRIGSKIGWWKVKNEGADCRIYANKNYRVGENVRMAGVFRAKEKINEFERGVVSFKRMITLNTSPVISNVGKFRVEKRNLKKMMEDYNDKKELLEEEKVHIDEELHSDPRKYYELIRKHV